MVLARRILIGFAIAKGALALKASEAADEDCGPECLAHFLSTAHTYEHGTLEAVNAVEEAMRDGMKEVRNALSDEDKPATVDNTKTKKANKLAADSKETKTSGKARGFAGIKDWLSDIKKMSDSVKSRVKEITAEIKAQVDGEVKAYSVAQSGGQGKVLQFSKQNLNTLKHKAANSLQECIHLLNDFIDRQQGWYTEVPLPPALAQASDVGKKAKKNHADDELARTIKHLEEPVMHAQKQMKEAAQSAAKDIGGLFKSWAKSLRKISKEVAEQVDQREHPELAVA